MNEKNGNGKTATMQDQLSKFQEIVKKQGKGAQAFVASFHVLKNGKIDHIVEISEGFPVDDFGKVTDVLDEAIERNIKTGSSAKDRM